MTGQGLIIAISVAIIALAFVALVVFLITTLISLRQTLKTTNEICSDLENKIRSFDPYVRMISEWGQTIEKKSDTIRQFSDETETYLNLRRGRAENIVNLSAEIAEIALLGLGVWNKFKKRK